MSNASVIKRDDFLNQRQKEREHAECAQDASFAKCGVRDKTRYAPDEPRSQELPSSVDLSGVAARNGTSAQPDTTGKVYGYARVSSRDQNLDRQLDAFAEFGIEEKNIYADKASGKDFNRPRYRTLMRKLRPGDVVVIKSIDRLGRNYEEIIDEWRHITKKRRAAIVVLDMPLLDTRVVKGNLTGVFIADIMLQLLSYVAQIERENTKQRQAEGIASARARGVKFGRPRIKKPGYFPHVRAEFLAGRMTRKAAADLLGVSPATFDNWMRE